ncbi:MAG TPA: hypothetical protein VEO01_19590 [Pseudonocardiaceae bacterium]|nr:hypothetical protein [Pseudonocardiaceae bacterium]
MTELSTTVPLHLGDVAVLGLLAVGLFLLGRLGWIVIDLAIDTMRRGTEYSGDIPNHGYAAFDSGSPASDRTAVMDATREVPEDDEPSWPGKAPLLRPALVLHEQAVVLGGNPARFDLASVLPANGSRPETASETSGRHAKVDGDDTATGLIPVVDDEAALAVVAAVSSQDGVS